MTRRSICMARWRDTAYYQERGIPLGELKPRAA